VRRFLSNYFDLLFMVLIIFIHQKVAEIDKKRDKNKQLK